MPQDHSYYDKEEAGKRTINDILIESLKSNNYSLALDMALTLCSDNEEATDQINKKLKSLEKKLFPLEEMEMFLKSGARTYELRSEENLTPTLPERFTFIQIKRSLNKFRREIMTIVWQVENDSFGKTGKKEAIHEYWKKLH